MKKFRAWDQDEKKMFLIDKLNEAEWVLYLSDAVKGKGRPIFMQYVGRQDIHGRDIYEGDIVRAYMRTPHEEWWQNFTVVEQGMGWKFRANVTNIFTDKEIAGEYWYLDRDEDEDIKFEIIGNIYENPELVIG